MAKIKKCIIAFILMVTIIIPPWTVKAGGGGGSLGGFATEVTQWLNYLELLGIDASALKEVAQQAQQLINEAMMIENQLKNLLALNNNPLAVINALNQLSAIVQQGQVLSYASMNIDAQYANLYPGYSTYRYQDMSYDVLMQKHQNWSQQNMDNVKDALKAAGVQEETILNEENRLNTIVDMSKSSEGRLQAIQAGNLIAAEEVSSLQRLRQLVMTNIQLMANYQAHEQDKEDVNNAKWGQISGSGTSGTILGDERSILNDF